MQSPKVAVLGLDGVPYSLLKKLMADGVTPNLAAIAQAGSFLQIESSVPPISSVAWTSFMTGSNPGEHGIYGFTDLKFNERALSLPSFDNIKTPVLWNLIPDRRSIIVNLPFTYPARPMNGILIAGFVAPIFERAVYPESLLPMLKSRNYSVDVDSVKGRSDRQGLLDELVMSIGVHESVVLDLQRQSWDLYVAVVTGTDRLHHFFYDAYSDLNSPYHQSFIDYYKRIDLFVKRFADNLTSDTRFILLSDHGFTDLKAQFYINNILKTLGYLTLSGPNARTLQEIHSGSSAFALDPGRIYLNTKKRFSDGLLTETAAKEVRGKLKRQLETLRPIDLGVDDSELGPEPFFQNVFTKEEIYYGSRIDYAPDLIILPRQGIDLKAALNAPKVVDTDIFTGTHTQDDAFLIACNPPISDGFALNISSVSTLILEMLNN